MRGVLEDSQGEHQQKPWRSRPTQKTACRCFSTCAVFEYRSAETKGFSLMWTLVSLRSLPRNSKPAVIPSRFSQQCTRARGWSARSAEHQNQRPPNDLAATLGSAIDFGLIWCCCRTKIWRIAGRKGRIELDFRAWSLSLSYSMRFSSVVLNQIYERGLLVS